MTLRSVAVAFTIVLAAAAPGPAQQPPASPIAAAKNYGAHGVGIDIDPDRVREATQNAKSSGVADKVTFKAGDLFTADISPATVVTLYLLETLNLKLAPKLMKE